MNHFKDFLYVAALVCLLCLGVVGLSKAVRPLRCGEAQCNQPDIDTDNRGAR
jgi:hypothetical protein